MKDKMQTQIKQSTYGCWAGVWMQSKSWVLKLRESYS